MFEAWKKQQALRKEQLREEVASLYLHPTPITLEIGCGNGHFLTSYAEQHPDQACVGFDRLWGRIERANDKRQKRELPNLTFLRAEAVDFFDVLPDHWDLIRIFVLFPDPWPKFRHLKNRLLQEPFLTLLANRVAPGAPLYFRTDHEAFFAWTREQIEQCPRWSMAENEPWPFEAFTVFQDRAPSYQSLIARENPPETG